MVETENGSKLTLNDNSQQRSVTIDTADVE
jgi:hypothetical protein